MTKKQKKITVEFVNPEALPQASINLTKAVAKMLVKKEAEDKEKEVEGKK